MIRLIDFEMREKSHHNFRFSTYFSVHIYARERKTSKLQMKLRLLTVLKVSTMKKRTNQKINFEFGFVYIVLILKL